MNEQLKEIYDFIKKQKDAALQAHKLGEDEKYIMGKIVAYNEIQGVIKVYKGT